MDPLLLNFLGACAGAPIGTFIWSYWFEKAGFWYSLKASAQMLCMMLVTLGLIYGLTYYTSTLIMVD